MRPNVHIASYTHWDRAKHVGDKPSGGRIFFVRPVTSAWLSRTMPLPSRYSVSGLTWRRRRRRVREVLDGPGDAADAVDLAVADDQGTFPWRPSRPWNSRRSTGYSDVRHCSQETSVGGERPC